MLSRETLAAIVHTVDALIPLANNLLDERGLEYILFGNISSDYLSNGSDGIASCVEPIWPSYFKSIPQSLQAERNLCLCQLVEMGVDILGIQEIFENVTEGRQRGKHYNVIGLLEEIDSFIFEDVSSPDCANESIIFYLAGYDARCLMLGKCHYCHDVISPGKVKMQLQFKEDATNNQELEAQEDV